MKNLIEKINSLNLIERFSLDNKKLLLIFILSITLIYFDYNYLLKKQVLSSGRLAKEIARINNDLRALDAGLKNIQAVKSSKATPKIKAKKAILEKELTALLNDISKIANINNVRIIQIKPAYELQKTSLKFSPFLINLDLIAGYHNFGKFINTLENNEFLILIESFKIEAQAKDPLRQKIAVTLKTYVKK